MVVLEQHRLQWADAFVRERGAIERVLASATFELHHIGSTAVPGLPAKPVIDMLLVITDIAALDEAALVALGYEARGEYGIPGRLYFVKNDAAGARSHHLHAFATGDPAIRRHLAFRDLLRTNPSAREDYASAKRKALLVSNGQKLPYQAGKSATILRLLAQAESG